MSCIEQTRFLASWETRKAQQLALAALKPVAIPAVPVTSSNALAPPQLRADTQQLTTPGLVKQPNVAEQPGLLSVTLKDEASAAVPASSGFAVRAKHVYRCHDAHFFHTELADLQPRPTARD